MSQQEAIKFNNFFGPEFVEKELIKEFPENHKIAVITNKDFLNEAELKMTYTQVPLFSNSIFTVYEFDAETWNTSYYHDQILQARSQAITDVGQDWMSQEQTWFYYNSWDDHHSEGLKGKGSFESVKNKGHDELVSFQAEDLDTGAYTVSFWYNHYIDKADIMCITEYEYNNGEVEWADSYDIKESTHIVGHWMFIEMEFQMTSDVKEVRVLVCLNNTKKEYLIDELLVRKTNGPPLFSTGKIGGTNYIIYNNYWIKEGSFTNQNP
jgi:hypothetical protein